MLNIINIAVIILALIDVFLYCYIFTTAYKHSKRIDDVRDNYRDDYRELEDKLWTTKYVEVVNVKDDLERTNRRVRGLENDMEKLREVLRMQGIATEVKTEEVKVLVKPEDTDDEDTDN